MENVSLTLSQSYNPARALDLTQHNSEAFQPLSSVVDASGFPGLGNVMLNNYVPAATQNNNNNNNVNVADIALVKKQC